MSIKIMNYVWEHSKQKGTELLLLLALADFADDSGDCYPSINRLAKKARTGERNTQKLLRKLETAREITIHETAGIETGHGKTNRYTVHTRRVNSSTPGEQQDTARVNARTPLGVNSSSPKPSVEPSVEPSVSMTAPLEENSSADETQVPSSPVSGAPSSPKRGGAAHYGHYLALLACWNYDPQAVTNATRVMYMGVAKQLSDAQFPLEQITGLHAYVARKAKDGRWTSWTVNALAKYADEYRTRLPKRPAQQSDEPEFTGSLTGVRNE